MIPARIISVNYIPLLLFSPKGQTRAKHSTNSHAVEKFNAKMAQVLNFYVKPTKSPTKLPFKSFYSAAVREWKNNTKFGTANPFPS